ncbi:hypothetical protein HMPREF0645_1594 [Hallella bergensis DSM 17361]|uniref:Uncharacterized protein n=1 Tax=Hallella bergensis DSM 17361 TaxID=585502 RepID=D1PXA9_9BACT|nr:hypothetical protein HMPREF0645_1594 [Hallella bergensis DSM 17361]
MEVFLSAHNQHLDNMEHHSIANEKQGVFYAVTSQISPNH